MRFGIVHDLGDGDTVPTGLFIIVRRGYAVAAARTLGIYIPLAFLNVIVGLRHPAVIHYNGVLLVVWISHIRESHFVVILRYIVKPFYRRVIVAEYFRIGGYNVREHSEYALLLQHPLSDLAVISLSLHAYALGTPVEGHNETKRQSYERCRGKYPYDTAADISCRNGALLSFFLCIVLNAYVFFEYSGVREKVIELFL